MDTKTVALDEPRITGRDALARIIAAIDDGAPCPDEICGLTSGALIDYHRINRADPYGDAAAMVRALGIEAEPKTTPHPNDDYHCVSWSQSRFDPYEHWSVTAFVTDEPPAPERKLITDPVELAAAHGIPWPADSCRCCGAGLHNGRCNSWDADVDGRPDNCTCPTGGTPSTVDVPALPAGLEFPGEGVAERLPDGGWVSAAFVATDIPTPLRGEPNCGRHVREWRCTRHIGVWCVADTGPGGRVGAVWRRADGSRS